MGLIIRFRNFSKMPSIVSANKKLPFVTLTGKDISKKFGQTLPDKNYLKTCRHDKRKIDDGNKGYSHDQSDRRKSYVKKNKKLNAKNIHKEIYDLIDMEVDNYGKIEHEHDKRYDPVNDHDTKYYYNKYTNAYEKAQSKKPIYCEYHKKIFEHYLKKDRKPTKRSDTKYRKLSHEYKRSKEIIEHDDSKDVRKECQHFKNKPIHKSEESLKNFDVSQQCSNVPIRNKISATEQENKRMSSDEKEIKNIDDNKKRDSDKIIDIIEADSEIKKSRKGDSIKNVNDNGLKMNKTRNKTNLFLTEKIQKMIENHKKNKSFNSIQDCYIDAVENLNETQNTDNTILLNLCSNLTNLLTQITNQNRIDREQNKTIDREQNKTIDREQNKTIDREYQSKQLYRTLDDHFEEAYKILKKLEQNKAIFEEDLNVTEHQIQMLKGRLYKTTNQNAMDYEEYKTEAVKALKELQQRKNTIQKVLSVTENQIKNLQEQSHSAENMNDNEEIQQMKLLLREENNIVDEPNKKKEKKKSSILDSLLQLNKPPSKERSYSRTNSYVAVKNDVQNETDLSQEVESNLLDDPDKTLVWLTEENIKDLEVPDLSNTFREVVEDLRNLKTLEDVEKLQSKKQSTPTLKTTKVISVTDTTNELSNQKLKSLLDDFKDPMKGLKEKIYSEEKFVASLENFKSNGEVLPPSFASTHTNKYTSEKDSEIDLETYSEPYSEIYSEKNNDNTNIRKSAPPENVKTYLENKAKTIGVLARNTI